jgi:hypothetical protein
MCGNLLRLVPEYAGRKVKCPRCNATIIAPEWDQEAAASETGDGTEVDFSGRSPSPSGMSQDELIPSAILERLSEALEALKSREIGHQSPAKQYKVLTQKDKWFSGKFDPELIEKALNAYAQQGWAVKSVTSASIPGAFGVRDELIVILER